MSIIKSFFSEVSRTENEENKGNILPYYGNEDIEGLEWTAISYVNDERPLFSDKSFMLNGPAPKDPISDIILKIEEIVAIMRDAGSVFFYREVNDVLEVGSSDTSTLLRIKLTV